MMPEKVDFDSLNWSRKPGVEERIVTRKHHSGELVEIPVARIRGVEPGPQLTVMSGMHAGEYSGILAAQKLISTVKPEDLSGTLLIVPVISTRAFMERNMQLNPVDQKEVHSILPGNPGGTYSDMLIDTLFELVKESDYLIDSHAGEMAQALFSWVPVPMWGPDELREKSLSLALGFDVKYVEPRYDEASIPPFCLALLSAGIPNIWVECGKNGVPTESDTAIHFDGYLAAMRTTGMLEGEPARPNQETLKGRRSQVNAEISGVWHPAIKEGDIVEKGQYLGRMTDYFGNLLKEYHAPARSLVLYYWSNPAINADRRPHDYDWHNGLVSLLELED
ncbi:MAG: succinylglutamate desuccinylase/aspartoacylase family protein [Dehalococcoidia bacterium]|nr:succinylglutamate desuccinylase/aspartoacylase family protein [Dehalococcoidia bacterium]